MNKLPKCKNHVGEGAIRTHTQLRSGYLSNNFWISESTPGSNNSATSCQVAINSISKNLKIWLEWYAFNTKKQGFLKIKYYRTNPV